MKKTSINSDKESKKSMSKKVRVAIIGVGNCASSLVQGVQFYKKTPDDATVPGMMHVNLGGYHIRDIDFTLGIDINATKVGKDLSEAIFAEPNNTYQVLRRAQPERTGGARHDPRRAGQVSLAVSSRKPPDPPPTSSSCSRKRRPTWWSPTCRSALRWPPNGTWSRSSRRAAPSSTPSRSSSHRPSTGANASAMPDCPSWATTSSRRSARPSCTASSPACSWTAACKSTAPTSSTSAATPIS